MDKDEVRKETEKHRRRVAEFMLSFEDALSMRALGHDRSKLREPEFEHFCKATEKLRGLTYGSEEYKEALKELKPALDHHYMVNSHHPEFHQNGVDDMTLMDLVEMFCDWRAATERHADGCIFESIKHNKERFGLSPQLAQILKNTAKHLKDRGGFQ